MRFIRFFVFLLISTALGRSVTLSEKDALFWALETSKSIAVTRISLTSDSLSLEQTRAGWLPEVDLDGSGTFTPLSKTGSGGSAGSNSVSAGADLDVSVSQSLPGGGTVTGSAGQGVDQDFDPSATLYTTSYGVSVSQPLLKDAGIFGSQDYSLRVKNLSSREFSLSQKKSLISTLSSIRGSFWTCYEASQLTDIAGRRLEYAAGRLEAEKNRLALGQAAPLDTLSAALDWLRARQDELTAGSRLRAANRALGEALMLAGEGIELAGDIVVTVDDLPAEDDFLDQVRQFDPELRVFELAAEQLALAEREKKNALLPDLTFSGSYSHENSGTGIFSDNTSSSDNAVLSLIAGYSLPTKSARIEVTKARLSVEQKELERKQYELELGNRVRELRESWEEEQLKLEIMTASRAVAEKQLDAARQGYELGTVDRLELQKAENDYTGAEISLLQAQVTLKRLEIVFDEITGKILTRFGVTL